MFWITSSAILLLAIVTRFLWVDEKPFHHDESLHAYYSQYVAAGNPHKYDGLLHGPFLYYFVGLFMRVFGVSDFTAHLPASLFGVLVVASPLFLRKHWGSLVTLVLMFFLLISPTEMYFGRFLREDVFTSIWVLGTVFGLLRYLSTKEDWCLVFAFTMLSLHFTNKENSYLHVFIWGAALLAIRHFGTAKKLGFEAKPIVWMSAALSFVTIYVFFYSSFFQHPDGWWNGVVDGVYRKSLFYWWEQNRIRRIDGPFDYHLPLLFNYEFILVPFVASAWFRFAKFKKTLMWISLGVMVAIILPRVGLERSSCQYAEYCHDTSLSIFEPVARLMHLSHSRQFLQVVLYLVAGAAAFWGALQAKKHFLAFMWFWLVGALGIYSYVGEKVPWLSLYILLPATILAALEVESLFSTQRRRKLVYSLVGLWLLLTIPFTIFKAIRVSFFNDANPVERLVYTQTTPEVKKIVERWKKSEEKLSVTVVGEATWPMAWYFNDVKGTFVMPNAETASTYAAFIVDTKAAAELKAVPGYTAYKLPLRAWWVPGVNPTWKNILKYFFTSRLYPRFVNSQEDDTGIGATNVIYFERETLSEKLGEIDFLSKDI